MSIAVVIRKCERIGSSGASISVVNVCSLQLTNPSGGLRRTSFLSFLGSSPAFASSRAFSTSCSGAWATT